MNRLLSTALGGTHSYGYRVDGLRAWTRPTATAAKTYYYYDQGNAVLETTGGGGIRATNVFAPDGLVSRKSTPVGAACTGDYLFDWQGNAVHCLFSGARYTDEPLIHSAYNAWGQRNFVYSNGAGSVSDLLRFGYNARWGYKLDTETGLYYCQHRYYDPANGRWVTRDPIGFEGGINVYGYCKSHAPASFDRSGHLSSCTANPANAAVCAEALADIYGAEAGVGATVDLIPPIPIPLPCPGPQPGAGPNEPGDEPPPWFPKYPPNEEPEPGPNPSNPGHGGPIDVTPPIPRPDECGDLVDKLAAEWEDLTGSPPSSEQVERWYDDCMDAGPSRFFDDWRGKGFFGPSGA